jgi:putative toxin-antitoxin system antitoxin component (TIGR02293 family)
MSQGSTRRANSVADSVATQSGSWQSIQALQSRWIAVFCRKALHEAIKSQARTDLPQVGRSAIKWFREIDRPRVLGPLEIHHEVARGLPGPALFVSAAMGFDTMSEAWDYFDVSNKTMRRRLDEQLSVEQGEQALRLATVAGIATEHFGSLEAGKRYLHTPNFALGGETPIELLRTATGEDLVLQELQAQIDGGPV